MTHAPWILHTFSELCLTFDPNINYNSPRIENLLAVLALYRDLSFLICGDHNTWCFCQHKCHIFTVNALLVDSRNVCIHWDISWRQRLIVHNISIFENVCPLIMFINIMHADIYNRNIRNAETYIHIDTLMDRKECNHPRMLYLAISTYSYTAIF